VVFWNKGKMCGEKGEKQMLNDKICKLREKLNESIINGEDYSIIYQLSIELDELIAQYYEKLTKNSWLKYFYSI